MSAFNRVQSHQASETTVLPDLRFTVHFPVPDDNRYLTEAAIKVKAGVKYITQFWFDRPTEQQIARECSQHGHFSPRPFHLGIPTDESTFECVLALFYQFCCAFEIDATAVLVKAYPDRESAHKWTKVAWERVVDCAKWHGTIVPDEWRSTDIQALLACISSQGHLDLAEVLAQELCLDRSPT